VNLRVALIDTCRTSAALTTEINYLLNMETDNWPFTLFQCSLTDPLYHHTYFLL